MISAMLRRAADAMTNRIVASSNGGMLASAIFPAVHWAASAMAAVE